MAARADSLHSASDGSIGDKFRAELEAKIDKLMEPPPVKTVKALPLPLEGQRKKRGGRRFVFIFISSYILPLQISLRSPFFAFFVFISPIIPIHLLIAPFSFPFSSTLVAFSSLHFFFHLLFESSPLTLTSLCPLFSSYFSSHPFFSVFSAPHLFPLHPPPLILPTCLSLPPFLFIFSSSSHHFLYHFPLNAPFLFLFSFPISFFLSSVVDLLAINLAAVSLFCLRLAPAFSNQ